MDRSFIGVLIGIVCLTVLPTAQALPGDAMFAPGTSRFTLDTGITVGGDKLAYVKFTNGSTKYLYAGNTLYVDLGFLQNFPHTHWSLKGTVGYAADIVPASNATFTFSRYPVDVLAIYNNGRHHFGMGVTYHLNPNTHMAGFAPNASFNNAAGFVLQYQYWLFGIRYTSIRYTASGSCISNCTFDGSNVGVFFNYAF